ncbi:uncharacterized protein LOC132302927 isoform X2 [Cornus florida]|uniref:uncharacterized protein LOC132302927 isoform X2 n=1 Tax=Cornus florida TaxID=4283 RepID=UPI00289D1228|nr:uncharacterized protein LOC132302927 isoform X2 [Cornus florida]
MNFLLRSSQTAAAEQPSVQESQADINHVPKPMSTLEVLIAQDPFPPMSRAGDHGGETDGIGGQNGGAVGRGRSAKSDPPIVENHMDVAEDEGFITIPYSEQVHILACLSACKQETEIITPFKVAAAMSKNGIGTSTKKQNGSVENETNSASESVDVSADGQEMDQNSETNSVSKDKIDPQKDISDGESLLRMEDHKRRTETLLRRFRNSHFFVRLAELDEPLWSKRSDLEASPESFEMVSEKLNADSAGTRKTAKTRTHLNMVIDRGNFDASVSGGLARNAVKCSSLSNGDIVVLLQVSIGVDIVKDPILEILQFEKYQDRNLTSENQDNLVKTNQDPCGELLKWLLPLDNSIPPPPRSLSPPPPLSSSSSIRSTSIKPNFAASSGSQLFSFGNFRSYSMSSLPQNTAQPPPATIPTSKSSFDLDDWDQFSSQKIVKSQRTEEEGLLSFRGVSLEPERFSVCCGLEGMYVPGRRWRRKLEIVQPVEINSFAADCNTDDLLCVQIKNVSPAHTPDIVVYLDAITIIFEEASKGGPPLSLPIACIEAGNDYSLPNLALRRGEEHSFILKPATSMWKNPKGHGESSRPSHFKAGSAAANSHLATNIVDGRRSASTADQYAVLVSCRCNYTESRLFFKKPTSWRPRISRDLMISVASEMSRQTLGSNIGVPQLPVQVLTLQASNLTAEDLTLTVLAPASFTSPPSVLSLNSSPSSPMSPFVGSSELTGRVVGERRGTAMQRHSPLPLVSGNGRHNGDHELQSVSFNEQDIPTSDVLPCTDLGCTHLWLQSRVPLGCVPSHSTATIKLELLPLTDGIITLDSLQIDVKEKGLSYVPEHSLKINATSSIATGIM